MTRSRGQFDTRHADGDSRGGEPPDGDQSSGAPTPWHDPGGVRAWASFHRVEFVLAVLLVVGGVGVPLVFGLGTLVLAPDASAVPQPLQSLFWTSILLAMPLLAAVLLVHAAIDAYRVAIADGEIASVGRVGLRTLQTASALAFALGVKVLFQDTAPANAEFDPAVLLSAFMLLVGFVGMLAFVAADGLVRIARGTF